MLNKPLRISEVPQIVMLGKHVLDKTAWTLKRLKLSNNGAIITGPNIHNLYYDDLDKNLSSENYSCDVYQVNTSQIAQLEKIKEEIANHNYTFIIGFGGGKVIDATKYFVKDHKNDPELIIIPTSTPHDGIASPFIFLNNPSEQLMGMGKTITALLADLTIINKAKQKYMIAAVGDLLAKQTAVWDWKLAYRLKNVLFSNFSYKAALKNSEIVFEMVNKAPSLETIDKKREIIKALIITGFLTSFQKEIRTGFGSEHLFALKLDELAPGKTLHGERVGLGTIISASLQDQNWRSVRTTLKKIGAPVNAEQLGLRPSVIAKALLGSHTVMPNFYTILGESGMTEEGVWNLLYQTGIVGDLLD